MGRIPSPKYFFKTYTKNLTYPPIILFNTDSVQTQTLITLMRSAGITPNIHMYCSQLVTVLNFVRGGKCGAFLYSFLAANHSDFLKIPVTPEISSRFGIIWKKGIFISDQLNKFITFVKKFDTASVLCYSSLMM